MTNPATLLTLLISGHALADYPLQGDFLSKAKNRANPIPGVPWYQGLWAHSAIQGGMIGLVTGSLALGIFEFIAHWIIDDGKSMGYISYNEDQALHVVCKIAWVLIMAFRGPVP